MLAGTKVSSFYNQHWYLDSGASDHVTPEATNLMDSISLPSIYHVQIGNGQGLSITSRGSMVFPSNFCPHRSLKLSKLLPVPNITKNLISVSQFAKDNSIFFEFHANSCFVKCQTTSKILLSDSLGPAGLYKFDCIPPPSSPKAPSIGNTSSNLKSLSTNFSLSYCFNTLF